MWRSHHASIVADWSVVYKMIDQGFALVLALLCFAQELPAGSFSHWPSSVMKWVLPLNALNESKSFY